MVSVKFSCLYILIRQLIYQIKISTIYRRISKNILDLRIRKCQYNFMLHALIIYEINLHNFEQFDYLNEILKYERCVL